MTPLPDNLTVRLTWFPVTVARRRRRRLRRWAAEAGMAV